MTSRRRGKEPMAAAVVGVGSMGRQHARVYSELPGIDLVGVHDADAESAEDVADAYETESLSMAEVLDAATVVSVAVPTEHHYDVVKTCLENDVNVLVEKPFVTDREQGEELATLARQRGLVLQVGHIERFNPATRVLKDVVPDLDLVAFDVQRLGPPIDRDIEDSVVLDLMVHDLDILLALVDSPVEEVTAAANGRQYALANLVFEDGTVASLTASRRTRQKIRQLSVTAESCRVNVDFIDQAVDIHRESFPEYVESNGDIRYRHESVVEQPMVENGEPLKAELESFVTAVREGTPAEVTPEDALRVQELAERIEAIALEERREVRAR
ncbi:Gfo/Idh/MocA family oxidoreductase [Halorubellus sp. JP-L1]|uniref:Gfo/Idh/MocA family protein n=1 Tax=Halorubellus sp. JP-L1 TaxID=2715753 RepID=UPI0014082190|nr:Gfo/Idh/MocA family oxidoreductase [Halorubellus sp. JP-L1]NHN43186.1 Gfo/Idh/MocA family oxidoreductase [Halorubellus sp. JP-L1]